MFEEAGREALPPIIVSEADYERLSELAAVLSARSPETANRLLEELDRADVIPVESFPQNTVRIGSRVHYRWDGGPTRSATLVLPADADISEGKVSVLTPVGTALLGLSHGQTIAFRANSREHHRLTILRVEPVAGDAP